jgi:hypothetical protein
MGRELDRCDFSEEDFSEFKERLREENRILMDWFADGTFEDSRGKCGFELEAWLVDGNFLPASINQEFLASIANHLVVPELSKFNFEINSTPHPVEGGLLRLMAQELDEVWRECEVHAEKLDARVLAVGILPTVRDELLTLDNITEMRRYIALNREILRLRKNRPLKIDIRGKDVLSAHHDNVMLEAAATSLQIHLQVSPRDAVRHYNLAQIFSAPMVAVAANSPFLFSRQLWDETRIPTFEQSVSVASFRDRNGNNIGRVTFGTGYARHSLMEPFLENLDGFPILLPLVIDEDAHWLSHLRLHNGTIWRWNRPLIGLGEGGRPHIRIEHRVPAAGPSRDDIIANIAFYLGLVHFFIDREPALETQIDFESARNNFYRCARHGLKADIHWIGNEEVSLRSLVLEQLLPAAREGLRRMDIDEEDISYYLDQVVGRRVESGQNGAQWQRDFIARNGPDFEAMTSAYHANQKNNIPVHEWTLSP